MNSNFSNNPLWPTEEDYLTCLRLSDTRKAQVKAEQEAAKSNQGLCEYLRAESLREGRGGVIDWPRYFRNAGMN